MNINVIGSLSQQQQTTKQLTTVPSYGNSKKLIYTLARRQHSDWCQYRCNQGEHTVVYNKHQKIGMCTPWLSPNKAWLERAPTRSGNMEQRTRGVIADCNAHPHRTNTMRQCGAVCVHLCLMRATDPRDSRLGVRCSVRVGLYCE